MLKSIKKASLLIVVAGSLFISGGCKSYNFNDSKDDQWIEQQIKNGTLTEAEAQEIREQAKGR